ncbi:MAG: ATP-dependent DNA helicase RecQ [bacterium]|nr:ATP-dependent DNA helicase RecQ [bacterium]
MTIHEILKQYWGHSEFRPLQEDIIHSVLSGKDTLALLPTGGGKSICFQVPALALPGMCLVVSPLIALMKDQVENLQKLGIQAQAIYSGLHYQEIQLILNNCVHGGVKFLYVSPERLGSDLIKDHLEQMKISLLAIDEAHCISQWGFDFRPEYRKILAVREYLPGVPVMALTATATARVVADIQEQLGFKETLAFRKSFERLNLHYIVRHHENKLEKMLNSVTVLKVSGLVYVRNRKLAEDISQYLIDNSVNASYYHAGLSGDLRQKRQDDWIQNKTRIMVCTNAFGMGIDKPDCRLVIHYQIPDCLEAYYQEAGRAGRNGANAFCMLLYHASDAVIMRAKLAQNFPEISFLREVYNGVGAYFKVPIDEEMSESVDFDLTLFSSYLNKRPVWVQKAIEILSQLQILEVSEALYLPSRVRILLPGNQLYSFQLDNPNYDELIKLLLRNFGGIFDYYVPISEKVLAMKINQSERDLIEGLEKLHQLGIIDYAGQKTKPQMRLKGPRVSLEYIKIDQVLLRNRKEMEEKKLEAMIAYAENENICRSRKLLAYFDEDDVIDCCSCDVCKEKMVVYWTSEKLQKLVLLLSYISWEKAYTVKELTKKVIGYKEEELAKAFRILVDNGILQLNSQQLLIWASKKA